MRSPCHQIDKLQKGLLKRLIWKDADGCVVRRGGIMGIVIEGGVVTPGDDIRIVLPDGEPRPLGVV
jgi:MOSC domain-containing protein YiiM